MPGTVQIILMQVGRCSRTMQPEVTASAEDELVQDQGSGAQGDCRLLNAVALPLATIHVTIAPLKTHA